MNDIVKHKDNFPVISKDIVEQTGELVGELTVGNIVVERGLARLYLIWKSRLFLSAKRQEHRCTACGLEYVEPDDICQRCGGIIMTEEVPIYPTLESYISYIADETGKSRQTLFNRLKVYRVLGDERGVDPNLVFELNLLSSGAARKLAAASDDNGHVTLENNSWEDTVVTALKTESKSLALEYVKYDVLHEPKISVVANGEAYTVLREYDNDDDTYAVEKYNLSLSGEWPEDMLDWLNGKLGVRGS